eukprot:COSAG06_NODE_772_length_12432_cov_119.880159_10_plen_69_part_00
MGSVRWARRSKAPTRSVWDRFLGDGNRVRDFNEPGPSLLINVFALVRSKLGMGWQQPTPRFQLWTALQ